MKGETYDSLEPFMRSIEREALVDIWRMLHAQRDAPARMGPAEPTTAQTAKNK